MRCLPLLQKLSTSTIPTMTCSLLLYLEKSLRTAIITFPCNTKMTRALLSLFLHIPSAATQLSALLKALTSHFSWVKRISICSFWHSWKTTLWCLYFLHFFVFIAYFEIHRKLRRNFRRQLMMSLRINLNFDDVSWMYTGMSLFTKVCCTKNVSLGFLIWLLSDNVK